MDNLEPWSALASAIAAAVTLLIFWRQSRESQLRRDEVLAWANEAIASLQTLLLICIDDEHSSEQPHPRLEDVFFDTSILVERGRLFFKNAKPADYGTHKEPAYRGYRPCILDPLVMAHQVAAAWPKASLEQRRLMRSIAEECLKKFVSLAQKEVGRSKTVSADTAAGGDGTHLRHRLAAAQTQEGHEDATL
ncbi:MAG: hypothetical protein EON58_06490 [Alphaproteobacteria bacterium]|nr:MAG: hypothetical protein EON58_06490 [Alphaproteobacteria bacterium]